MFIATALAYPCVLAVLCTGAGLLIDAGSGEALPAPLLPSIGAAALIALSQMTTYIAPVAPVTPYLIGVAALAGFLAGRRRVRSLLVRARELAARAWVPVIGFACALAPVLLAGRPSFSSFMALSDSAVHMIGADYLIQHGQDYSHLDLRNSYGQFINAYYNTSYPSGADTLFGASAWLLGLPLIWAFQPFNAFMLAIATGPAWLLARKLRLSSPWTELAALTITLPALVYAYALLGSVKEVTALAMILTLGALVSRSEGWLTGPARAAIPFALVVGAGVSALGVGFGAWALVAVAVLVAAVAQAARRGEPPSPPHLAALAAVGVVALAIAALPTWLHTSGSLKVAQNIASTSNPGNLHAPLKASQLFGVWLRGSYKLAPAGTALTLTQLLIGVVAFAALLGTAYAMRERAWTLLGWAVGMLVALFAIRQSATTWVGAKTLMLTSPVLLVLAWGGVAAVRSSARRWSARMLAPALALAITGGVLASDVLQYRASNLAPTARYDELASLATRVDGAGPTLFTDFDEYSLYQLRGSDVGGPDFVYPPPALAAIAGGYGAPVQLDRAAPGALSAYPVIVTRRDPTVSRPPAAYRLQWQGAYYELWRRQPHARAALAHLVLSGTPAQQCARIGAIARSALGARLYAARAPGVVRVSLAHALHPARWGHQRQALVMATAGRLVAAVRIPRAGSWQVWIQGQLMPRVRFALDGRPLASIAGESSGNSLVADTLPPRTVQLAAGTHTLTVSRAAATLAPGDGGAAVLSAVFLTPAGDDVPALSSVPSAGWRSLCGARYQWVEVVV